MNLEVESGSWRRRRWWILIGLIFVIQLGLIFLLSDRKPPRVRRVKPQVQLAFASAATAELWALSDPTLFALPNARGFSAMAWLKAPRLTVRRFDWTEPTNWLALSVERLGSARHQSGEAPAIQALASAILSEPEVTMPEISSPALPVLPEQSTWRLEGGLASLRLQNSLSLTNPAHSDWLTNSIVLLTVSSDGKPFSVPILLTGSGSKTADDQALYQASLLRFEPVLNQPLDKKPALVFGKVIFEWATIPLPSTNLPATVQP
jgi:hypothetical protein